MKSGNWKKLGGQGGRLVGKKQAKNKNPKGRHPETVPACTNIQKQELRSTQAISWVVAKRLVD